MGASILTRCNYSPKEIMSVTGHKSVQSLTIYQCVQDLKKIEMGSLLTTSLHIPDGMLPLASSNKRKEIPDKVICEDATTPKVPQIEFPSNSLQEPTENAVLPYEPNVNNQADFDLMSFITDLQNDEFNEMSVKNTPKVASTVTSTTMNQRNSPMFAACKIGNINITINKSEEHECFNPTGLSNH